MNIFDKPNNSYDYRSNSISSSLAVIGEVKEFQALDTVGYYDIIAQSKTFVAKSQMKREELAYKVEESVAQHTIDSLTPAITTKQKIEIVTEALSRHTGNKDLQAKLDSLKAEELAYLLSL